MAKKSLYIIVVILTFSTSLFCQTSQIEFDRYTTNDGLSNGYIVTAFQDSKGFIWVGTANGLNRFDGISFKSYNFEKNDSSTIPGNVVHSINEDSLGNIWIGTSNGLCLYERTKDIFHRKTICFKGISLSDFYVTSAIIDKRNLLWFSTFDGIYRFNIDSYYQHQSVQINVDNIDIVEDDVQIVNKIDIKSFAEDQNGNIWLASRSKNIFYNDCKSNKFTPILIDIPNQQLSNKAKRLFIDSHGDFYITISNTGLLVWHKKENKFQLYNPSNLKSLPEANYFDAIAEDSNGTIWIGDRNSTGISLYNRVTHEFTNYQQDDQNPYSLLSNKINTIYTGKSGEMWVGTIIGINKYSPGKNKFIRYFSYPNRSDKLSNNNILCFDESKNGDLWIGTDGGGLNRLNFNTGKYTQFKHDNANPNSISSDAIVSVCEDHEGILWLGTYNGGLSRMENNSFKSFFPDKSNVYSIADRHIWYVFEDSKYNLWVGTLSSGLDLYDRKKDRFYHFKSTRNDSSTLINNSIHGIFEDSQQQLYITTYQGVSIIDLNKCDFSKTPPLVPFKNLYHSDSHNSLSNNNVYCFNQDKKGNIWFGTHGSGLDKYDPKNNQFTNFSTKDGLPGNSIYSILNDDEGYLWLSTNKGLVKFDPDSKEFTVFNRKDGLQNNDLKSWALKTKKGEFFVGGAEGFNSFYPKNVIANQNQNKPLVVIIGLTIFNKPVKAGDKINNKIILTNEISETSELHLTYKENYFTFEFVGLDYVAPEKNNYAYKMEGFDKDWIQCGTRREASYSNLDPGEYTFSVKASNNDGIWNEKATTLKVYISPPWWETILFRIIALLLSVSVLSFIIISRIRHLKNKQLELEKLVNIKTNELQLMNARLAKQANELAESYSLLEERQEEVEAQSEELYAQKDALEIMNYELNELNATKDKFFSIIAHDIKTPFNSILGFTELLSSNFDSWSDKQKIDTINIVLNSSRHLYDLLENLLQWSRSQRGNIEFNPQPIQLSEVFHKNIEVMKGNADAKKISLTETNKDNNLRVNADPLMLDAIIRNLLSNAIKFTPAGGKIELSTEVISNKVKVMVTDNGIGMDDEIKNNLFKINSNHTSPGTNNEKGTGLGLVIAQDFVSRHGGLIGVDTKINEGSTFYFTLPLA